MFPAIANKTGTIPISDGREVWHGIHQSSRISHWKNLGSNALTLNLDSELVLYFRLKLKSIPADKYYNREK